MQAFAGGGVDLCICAGDHALRLASRGLGGAVLVALLDKHPYSLLAPINSPATDLKSLRGKAIGITSPGSLTDNTLRFMIRKLGFNPDSDYEIIAAGNRGLDARRDRTRIGGGRHVHDPRRPGLYGNRANTNSSPISATSTTWRLI